MGRILSALYDVKEFNLISLTGGNKRNAIPRECEAIISVRNREEASEIILNLEKDIRKELNPADKGFRVLVSKTGAKENMMSFKDTSRIISLLSLIPNGVISMSQSKKGLVETSSNLGVITHEENGDLKFFAYTRSSVEPSMDAVFLRLKRLAKALDVKFELIDRCPGWAFNNNSELQKLYLKAYEEEFGKNDQFPRVEAIHAGLECGIIIEKMGGGDAIAIGPTLHDIHTPKERLDLRSMERTWRLVVRLLSYRQ
jgi:dipeptidase D